MLVTVSVCAGVEEAVGLEIFMIVIERLGIYYLRRCLDPAATYVFDESAAKCTPKTLRLYHDFSRFSI
jgi:hypothetical protein